jgi:hypothetical protein
MTTTRGSALRLTGLAGSNPLGFLASLGTLLITRERDTSATLHWERVSGTWRPILTTSVEVSEREFAAALEKTLKQLPRPHLAGHNKLPFEAKNFRNLLRQLINESGTCVDRRVLDLCAALGSEVIVENDNFSDTAFRMVRSGDAAGQGFPAYVRGIINQVTCDAIYDSLFKTWDYNDSSFSLRWDPIEDVRYALRWNDPSKKSIGAELGATALATESLALFPVVPTGSVARTTGFRDEDSTQYFTWPIWQAPLDPDTIRTLLSLPDLHVSTPDVVGLLARGVVQVFRSRRFAPNQYYKNFSASVTL